MKFLRSLPVIANAVLLGWSSILIAEDRLSFNHDIRPILSENCFQCHGPDAAAREADLRLDKAEEAYKNRDGSPAIVPGDPEESLLIWMIEAEYEEDQMPPPDSNRSLTEEQNQTLRRWIEEGAEYDEHWAFIPPVKHPAPGSWENPVDGFIEAKLRESGWEFSTEADPKTWLRRASFDLTGLPPALEEYLAFEAGVRRDGERAYERKADELLTSPRYGERMAVDWMDAARYADTHGFNNDSERTMWRWRDWVIEAFNRNLPYDRFITEQLAGDLLPNPTLDQLIATGFTRNHVINSEGGIIEEEYRVEYVADRVRTVGMVWMGLTTECARCHDHKFDDFSQKDYYRLFAFFNSMAELGEDGRIANAYPILPSPTEPQRRQREMLERRLSEQVEEMRGYLNQFSIEPGHDPALQDHLRQIAADIPSPVWKLSSATAFTGDVFVPAGNAGESAAGIAGKALYAGSSGGIGSVKVDTIVVGKDGKSFSVAFWLQPTAADAAGTPLLSNAQFQREPSSTRYGNGWDVRLVGEEIELSVAQRHPAYSMIVRTRGADIQPGEWRHVVVQLEGESEPAYQMTPASRFSIFLDGVESRLTVRFDGLMSPPNVKELETRLGADLHPESVPFAGRLDEVQQFNSALDNQQAGNLFHAEAIPYLLGRKAEGVIAAKESRVLKTAVLDAVKDPDWLALKSAYAATLRELLELERAIPTTMVARELDRPRETFVLERGHYASPGERVQAGVPESLIALWPEDAPRNRLGLARWLTSDDNPLTARVVVNRFWQQLFGVGLVKTAEDFGVQSEFPSHPELLDWLAVDFRESGWDVKRLMKQLVLSKTYRQASRITPETLANDPENRLLSRGPRFRLHAEAIRDQALALSGLLDGRIGGPSVMPYQPEGIYNAVVVGAKYPGTRWIQSEGDDRYRRSLYTYWKRTLPYPALASFDAPEREVCTVQRSRTNTPLQALITMNGPTFVEASRAMAAHVLENGEASPARRIRESFLVATGRWPDGDETKILEKALTEMKRSFESDPSGAEDLLKAGDFHAGEDFTPEELAAYTSLMSLILNLDETLNKG